MLAAMMRLLTVAALVLMPFGMSAASASPADHAPATASAGHCSEQDGQPAEDSREPLAGCTAGCSMWMAEQASADEWGESLGQSPVRPAPRRWTSIPAETATPPPKRA